MKIALCDDEVSALRCLERQVIHQMKIIGEPCEIRSYTDVAAIMQSAMNFDILLLDIQFPEINGIAFAKEIRQKGIRCALIFISALKEYVFDVFEVEAIDYICKPVDEDKLKKALDRAIEYVGRKKEKSLFVQTMHWCRTIKLSSIFYCEVINRKIYLHTQEGVIEYYSTLEDVKQQLDSRFFQCHRSFLINLDFMQKYENDQVTLESGDHIPISRLRRPEFLKVMLQYLKKKGESS